MKKKKYDNRNKQLKTQTIMEITGKLVSRTAIEEGQTPKGPWKKRTIVIDTLDRYPQRIAFECWNDNVDVVETMCKNQVVTIDFDLSSREFNGRWYTQAKVYRFVWFEGNQYVRQQQQPSQQQYQQYVQPQQQYSQSVPQVQDDSFGKDDDLPF